MLNRCLLLGYLLLQSSKVGKTDTSTPLTISSVSLQNQWKNTKFCIWSEFPWDLKAHERAFKLCSRWLDFEWLAIVGWVILKVSTIQNSSKFLGSPLRQIPGIPIVKQILWKQIYWVFLLNYNPMTINAHTFENIDREGLHFGSELFCTSI